MFSNTTISIVILSIYLLVFINCIIVFIIFYRLFSDKLSRKRYQRVYNKLFPYINNYIDNEKDYFLLKPLIRNRFSKNITEEIMINYAKEKHIDISKKFERLDFVKKNISSAKKELSLNLIKKLGIMRSKEAFCILYEGTKSDDFEIKYMSYYSLSLLELKQQQLDQIIDSLLKSDVVRDRMIEILNNLNLQTQQYIDFLKKQNTEIGKVVFLRVLAYREDICEEKYSNIIASYIEDSKEVRLSTVLTLANTKKDKYLPSLVDLYEREDEWEVRAAIAKSMKNYSSDIVIEFLKRMSIDEAWWVRFNATEVLTKMGYDGIYALIELFLSDDENISELSYSLLNSNQNIYQRIKNIEI